MATMYCALCNRPVDARRLIGVGTIALAVATGGFWLLAVPFYPKRCSICKSSAVSHGIPDGARGTAPLARLVELERRLSLAEGELETLSVQLERSREESEFYRKLLGDPTRQKPRGQG